MDMSRGRNPSAAPPPPIPTATPVDLSGRLRWWLRRKRKSGTTLQVVTVCIFIILPTFTCRHSCVTPIHPPTHLVPCAAFVRVRTSQSGLRNVGTFHWRRRRRRRRHSAAARKAKNFRLTSRTRFVRCSCRRSSSLRRNAVARRIPPFSRLADIVDGHWQLREYHLPYIILQCMRSFSPSDSYPHHSIIPENGYPLLSSQVVERMSSLPILPWSLHLINLQHFRYR